MSDPAKLVTGKPVESLDIEFQWHEGTWKELFDKHVQFIQQDILRALSGKKLIVYLSCPISSRGGSYFATNVEIANFTVLRLSADWGPRFWFLNPAQYQMESAQGLGLIRMHAYELGLEQKKNIDVDDLMKKVPTVGGDYMRMWTRVLAEDGKQNLGDRFSAFYFLAPSDVKAFFAQTGAKNVSAGIESYFADKSEDDLAFHSYFSSPSDGGKSGSKVTDDEIQARREEFLRYYAVRASAYFSNGSHDEWNIWRELNARRIVGDEKKGYGMGSQIAGYFEGLQVDPGAAETPISAGYALPQTIPAKLVAPVSPKYITQTAELTEAVERLAQHGRVKKP